MGKVASIIIKVSRRAWMRLIRRVLDEQVNRQVITSDQRIILINAFETPFKRFSTDRCG